MEYSIVTVFICSCMYWQSSAGFNILVVLPNVEYEEFKETSKLAQQLSSKNHNVIVFSPFFMPENDYLHNILITGDVELVKSAKNKMYEKDYRRNCLLSKLQSDNEIGEAYLKLVVESGSFKRLINSETNFDLIILEDVGAYGLAVLSEIFKCPLITLLSEPLSPFYDNFVFDPLAWAQTDALRTAHYWLFKEFYREFFIFPKQTALLKQVIPKDFKEELYNTRLVLLPSYHTNGRLMPKYSHVKRIGGYNRLSSEKSTFNSKLRKVVTGWNISTDVMEHENVVVVSKRLPEIVKTEIEKLEFSIPVQIVHCDVDEIAVNHNVSLFIGDGNVYETDIVASMNIPIVRISENRWNRQFLADSLSEKSVILSASIKDTDTLKTVIEVSLKANLMFQSRLLLESLMIQSEREHQNATTNAIYWIEHVGTFDQNFYFENPEVKFDVQNHWIIIAVVLVVIDVLLFILFYWIFKHTLLHIIQGCFLLILCLLIKVFRVKLVHDNKSDRIEKAKLYNNDQLEKGGYVS